MGAWVRLGGHTWNLFALGWVRGSWEQGVLVKPIDVKDKKPKG